MPDFVSLDYLTEIFFFTNLEIYIYIIFFFGKFEGYQINVSLIMTQERA